MSITFEKFNQAHFVLYPNNPIIKRWGLSTIVADPSVLSPNDSDGKWHIFCHTLFGVYHFVSDDGIRYDKVAKVVNNAMRPDVKKIGDTYYMYYERVQSLLPRGLAMVGLIRWKSEIWYVTSKDLYTWSQPKVAVSHTRDYEDCKMGISISNPFLIKYGDKYRLYYSAGLSFLKDCNFSEPTHLSYAESDSPDGPFVSRATPIMSPGKDNPVFNEGCGCIKVYSLSDCLIGLINGIYTDGEGNSHSAVMLFRSEDGENFSYVKHLVEPQSIGEDDWMAQYVYASNLAFYEGNAYVYFNARNVADMLKGREHIGVSIAKLPE